MTNSESLKIIIFFLIIFAICTLMLLSALSLSAKYFFTNSKASEYECGFEPFDFSSRQPFHIHFYLVGILFVLFDVEIAMLFPWAFDFWNLTWISFYLGIFFIFFIVFGLYYEWKKKAIDWSEKPFVKKLNKNSGWWAWLLACAADPFITFLVSAFVYDMLSGVHFYEDKKKEPLEVKVHVILEEKRPVAVASQPAKSVIFENFFKNTANAVLSETKFVFSSDIADQNNFFHNPNYPQTLFYLVSKLMFFFNNWGLFVPETGKPVKISGFIELSKPTQIQKEINIFEFVYENGPNFFYRWTQNAINDNHDVFSYACSGFWDERIGEICFSFLYNEIWMTTLCVVAFLIFPFFLRNAIKAFVCITNNYISLYSLLCSYSPNFFYKWTAYAIKDTHDIFSCSGFEFLLESATTNCIFQDLCLGLTIGVWTLIFGLAYEKHREVKIGLNKKRVKNF